MLLRRLALFPLLLLAPLSALPRSAAPGGPEKTDEKREPAFTAEAFKGLRLRSIGPGLLSGRVVGLAIDPRQRSHYFAAVACGGVWKTTNGGTSWTPVFDNEGSYSIGYVTLDPRNPDTVWVGTGENNSQRSVGYGDGVYKSLDGGKTWKKMGLEQSEHVGRILIDPRHSDTVYVAAQGPLWGPGGNRGLYKTTDGGQTWKKILDISPDTGITDVVLDPRNPDVLLAASHQRRRHVWTLINGGGESALYRSTDGGAHWTRLQAGLPTVELGRIGLAVAPSQPNIVYASIEAADGKGGIFRSSNGGLEWERRNPFDLGAMYYGHLVVDPRNAERIYVMNVFIQVSDDGGKNLRRLGEKWKHVDSHCMWIDPADTDYYLVGCDGGIYESLDRAATWRHHANLPITQFYDVAVDQSGPFYHVYGGTQDNNSLGGPARTRSTHGITNEDWFVLHGGDGFHCKVDPRDPNIVYAEAQYGDLIRFDRRTGEEVGIRPHPGKGEPPLRWNWDSPLLLSPHSPTRLYFAANRIYRSDDRGDSWTPISGDLSRQLDRDKLPVMGRLWGPNAVARHQSTSLYGNIVALTESPRQENLLYAGTDDGLIHVTEDGGKGWRTIDRFPSVPARTYVARLLASQHAPARVYAAFDNHKNADFQPYVLRSDDAGRTWNSIASNLPANGPVLALAEDHEDPALLFAGTEFGLFFASVRPKQEKGKGEEGMVWTRLQGGFPTIAVRDLAIQKKANDLVVGTFGRGIYILDDYSLLRGLKPEVLGRRVHLFSVPDAWLYVPMRQYGLRGKAFRGEAFYTADNPPFGAVFTYHLGETLQTRKQKREAAEKKGVKEQPTLEELRREDDEEAPAVVLTVSNGSGKVVRTLTGPVTRGFHRVAWDLREPSPILPRPRTGEADEDLFRAPPAGPRVLPGTYKVSLALRVDGEHKPIAGEQSFEVRGLDKTPNEAEQKERHEFDQRMTRLERAVSGTLESANEVQKRLAEIKRALDYTPGLEMRYQSTVRSLEQQTRAILRALRGDETLRKRNENAPLSINEKIQSIREDLRSTLGPPTKTHRALLSEARTDLAQEIRQLRKLIDTELKEVEKALNKAGAPWTPGRLPDPETLEDKR